MLFVIPILTMRILSEERRNRTDQILLTTPIKTSDVVLGKYLAAVVVFLIVIALSALQPIVTAIVFKGQMSFQMTVGGYLAFLMLGLAFIAIGMFISAMTENQLIAAVITIALFSALMLTEGFYALVSTSRYVSLGVLLVVLAGVLFLVYVSIHDILVTVIVGIVGVLGLVVTFFIVPTAFDGLLGRILKSLSIFERYAAMFSGVFAATDVIFFVTVAAFFLFLTYQVIERRRWA